MTEVARQRISGVKLLEDLGRLPRRGVARACSSYRGRSRCHALVARERADALEGAVENSPEKTELFGLTETIEAYEAKRWPTAAHRVARG